MTPTCFAAHDKTSPSVFVIVPNKNGREHLSYSLRSLSDSTYANYQVVIVDDGSSDDSMQVISHECNEAVVIQNAGKRGFAGSVNTGIKYAMAAGAEYVAVFNSDIRVYPKWLDLVLVVFEREVKVGIVGFTEVNRGCEDLFFGSTVEQDSLRYSDVERLPGCLYVCPVELFVDIGLYDEDYFMYGEDNDLYARVLAAGLRLIKTNIPVWHYGEGSSDRQKLLATWLAYRNALRFSLKNERVGRTLHMLLLLVYVGCNPFLRKPPQDSVYKRVRRYNPVVNFFLVLGSCAWNMWHIRSTRKARSSRGGLQGQG